MTSEKGLPVSDSSTEGTLGRSDTVSEKKSRILEKLKTLYGPITLICETENVTEKNRVETKRKSGREILRESESMYSDTSGSTWQSSGPPNYNLLHAVCYTTRRRGGREMERRKKPHTEETWRYTDPVYSKSHTTAKVY